MTRSPYQIIHSPIVSEKTLRLKEIGKYVFWVDPAANKIEIRHAVEKLYQVKVKKVNTVTLKGKVRRFGRLPPGKTPKRKKAIVTVEPGQVIKALESIG